LHDVEIVVIELGGVAGNRLLGAPAEQLEHRLVERLAHQIPDRDIDTGDRRHADATPAPGQRGAIHALPQVFVVERILAHDQRRQMLVDDGLGDPRRQRHVTQTDQTAIGLDLDHRPAVKAEALHRIAAIPQRIHGIGAEVRLGRHGIAFPLEYPSANIDNLHCIAPW